MRCPQCGGMEDRVIDSRTRKDGRVIRRRRECESCQHRYTTYEEIEREDIRVVKNDGRYEPFDRKKMLAGIYKACEKRPVSPDTIETMADNIVDSLSREFNSEIPTASLGESIMDELRSLDEVAYVRFASVYRKFTDIHEFVDEIQNLNFN